MEMKIQLKHIKFCHKSSFILSFMFKLIYSLGHKPVTERLAYLFIIYSIYLFKVSKHLLQFHPAPTTVVQRSYTLFNIILIALESCLHLENKA